MDALWGIAPIARHCSALTMHGTHGARCQAMGDNAGTHKRCPYNHCFTMDYIAPHRRPCPHRHIVPMPGIGMHCSAPTVMAMIAIVAGQWATMRAPTIIVVQCITMHYIASHCRALPRIAHNVRIACHAPLLYNANAMIVGAPLVGARYAPPCMPMNPWPRIAPALPTMPSFAGIVLHCSATTRHSAHRPRCQAMGDNAGTHEDRPDDRCSAMEAMSA